MALAMQLRRMDMGHVTVHGFRSSFRDWCAECTNYPREVCEHALAHQLPDKVEAAYMRSDLLNKRRALMAEWANFCYSAG
jgi:integrase